MILKRQPDIHKFLRSPGEGVRAALIFGRDHGVVRDRAAQLAAAVTARPDDPFDTALLTDDDLAGEPARLEEELAAISMLGGRRLVRIRLGDGAKSERTVAEALAAHLEGRLNPDAFLLMEAWDLAKSSVLRQAAEKPPGCAAIACYADETGDIVRLTRDALAKEGLGLTSEAQQLFAARLPADRGVARQEIERLILYLGPGSGVTAGPRELEEFLGVEPEASLGDAARDAFGGREGAAQAHLRRAAREGLEGVAAVRAVSQHLAKLRRIAVARGAGAELDEAVRAAEPFWKAQRETSRQARNWSLAELDAVQLDVLAADMACRETGAPKDLIVERLTMDLAARARRLGL